MGGAIKRWWRPVASGLCITLAAIALVGSVVTHYLRDNILDTNGYLAIVNPLPQDPAVAAALASFTTTKLFDAGGAEKNIREFLPPKLAALAGPLTDTLQKRVNNRTKQFVQSDAFDAIWTTANKTAQKAVLRAAEPKPGQSKARQAVSSIDASKLLGTVREKLGKDGAGLTSEKQDRLATIQVQLHQSVAQLRTTVRLIKNGAYVLPYLSLALLLAALAISRKRRHTTATIAVVLALLGSILLIAFKLGSNAALDDVQGATYQNAANVVYEAFYANLRMRLVVIVIVGVVLFILTLCAGPYAWAKRLRRALGLEALKKSVPYGWARSIRRLAARYQPWIGLGTIIAAIIWLLALPTLTTATFVVILCLLVSVVALTHVAAKP